MARLSRAAERGFSLVEVMVALAIFALASLVLAASYLNILNSYNAAARGLEVDRDLAFCRQRLMKIADLVTAETGEEYDTPDNPPADPTRHVKWTADIQPFAGATPTAPTDLFTVTLTVAVSGQGGQIQNTVDTFMLLRPTWSDAATRSAQRQTNNSAIMQLQGRSPK